MAAAQRPEGARPMRADARRNAELLIATARDVFAEKGADAPLDEIAKRAGVGAGTLYRHFPNREVLIEAVYLGEMATMAERADELLAQHPPADALLIWLREHVRWINHQRGLSASLKSTLKPGSPTMNKARDLIVGAADQLLTAGRAAGIVRDQVEPLDLVRLGHGLAVAAEFGDTDDMERMLAVLIAGLRPDNTS